LLGAAFCFALCGCGRGGFHALIEPKRVEVAVSGPASASECYGSGWPARGRDEQPFIDLLEPLDGDQVTQKGAVVRFRVSGAIPQGVRPIVFVRDATGLESNWWAWVPTPTSAGVWECGVQYGEPRDAGRRLAVLVLMLPEAACPPAGTVGFLPAGALARCALGKVVRE